MSFRLIDPKSDDKELESTDFSHYFKIKVSKYRISEEDREII